MLDHLSDWLLTDVNLCYDDLISYDIPEVSVVESERVLSKLLSMYK